MRVLFVVFFLLSLSFAKVHSQTNKNFCSLEVNIEQEISLHGVFFWEKLLIAQPSGFKSFPIPSDGKVVVSKLSPGKYRVLVTSRFQQTIEKEIQINQNVVIGVQTKKQLKIVSPKTFIPRMKNGDTLFILHNATGTSVDKIELRLIKDKGQFYILKYIDRLLAERTTLAKADLEWIKSVERELASNKFVSGCSVIETYTLQLKGKYYSVNDNSCTWNGFARINSRFFNNAD